jgi:hypothetical protein
MIAMKYLSLVVGALVIAIAALLLADGILAYTDAYVQLLSLRGVKLAVGLVLVVLAVSYFQKVKE